MLTDRLLAHGSGPSSSGGSRWRRASEWSRQWSRQWSRRIHDALGALSSEWRDALLYGCSALFAGIISLAVSIPLYRQWGRMAVGPYALAAALMILVARRVAHRSTGDGPEPADGPVSEPAAHATSSGIGHAGSRSKVARVIAFLIVLLGATVLPLTAEVVWRTEGSAALHVQPEVTVVERAGVRAVHGMDPYRLVDRGGHVLIHQHAVPTYELYYPYLPGMLLFGVLSGSQLGAGLSDARIQFLAFTAVIALLALSRLPPRTDARFRSLQVIAALPTAALPLATGGDDMPVVALMLLGLVALQRRRPVLAGLALGAASSLKFSAWPLVVIAVWAAYDLRRQRAIGRYALGVAAVVVPVVVPVALWDPSAFIDNVIRFPLGLAGVSSPAASALPGHILISVVPGIHRAYVVLAAAVGVVVLVRYLMRRPPRNSGEVARLTGWVMLIAILLAPATRVGYLLYPINLFVWAWMLSRADDPAVAGDGQLLPSSGSTPPSRRQQPGAGQFSSDCSNSRRENGVIPAEVVGDTTTPTSQ
ncbi:MAG TPA: glycosyltransferase family 87 protein [Acidimicrobiales bacterium]